MNIHMVNGIFEKTEMKRLGVAKELLRKNVQNGNILEVGCGEGVFFKNVLDISFGFYEGIDVSNVAISKITKTENSIFSVADMETYHPKNAPFSVIIFNEVLYYSKNPISLLVRYRAFVKEDGVFLIGMYSSPKSNQIWGEIDEHFAVRESTEVKQDEKTWHHKIIGASKWA
jgi:2-polyprenyl-3-methyl-5-hydroxy-6-metoxy-1,4-benzoquinol methylase